MALQRTVQLDHIYEIHTIQYNYISEFNIYHLSLFIYTYIYTLFTGLQYPAKEECSDRFELFQRAPTTTIIVKKVTHERSLWLSDYLVLFILMLSYGISTTALVYLLLAVQFSFLFFFLSVYVFTIHGLLHYVVNSTDMAGMSEVQKLI